VFCTRASRLRSDPISRDIVRIRFDIALIAPVSTPSLARARSIAACLSPMLARMAW
jgi:hypothetical protein